MHFQDSMVLCQYPVVKVITIMVNGVQVPWILLGENNASKVFDI